MLGEAHKCVNEVPSEINTMCHCQPMRATSRKTSRVSIICEVAKETQEDGASRATMLVPDGSPRRSK